ncbi:hypothetical protein N8500_11135 [Candidatus Puniceispirillum sp.]|nr:hypothetical protein [Candidatus Puniceispirillum sp.]
MKTMLILSFTSIFFSIAVQAKQFDLSKPNDSYVSLNECLYAMSKGTRLSKGKEEVFIYQNQVWKMSFNEEQKYECKLIGELVE